MKYFVIADNTDTVVGLRLAGVEGVEAHDAPEAAAALAAALRDREIGVLLMSESLAAACAETLAPLKLAARTPLVVEIPDRHSAGRTGDSIARYVREAIGVRL